MLSLNDFDYLKDDLSTLVPYLKHAVKKRKEGVNILFYGKPGTGKTELSKAIAKTLKMDIYEVSYADEADEPITGDKRLKAFKVAQSFFKQKRQLLMFDEIEDVIGDDSFHFFAPKKQSNKGWINRMLESNPIPTIWITNDIYSMDNAVIRRFDMSIEIPVPPKEKRQEIVKSDCGNLLSAKSIERIAEHEFIAPALVTRAAKVAGETKGSKKEREKAFERILNHTLKAQGYKKIPDKPQDLSESLPRSYSLDFINTSIDLREVAKGIKRTKDARLCIYGVPGTGKSAYGKWIAHYLEKPFILKKGSDLLSKWVGGTEENIARAFEEANEKGAVLIFDEVDSFLQDRRGAKNGWEVTQVNEMLVQMENFKGIFIATTNLMDGLDQASLRRFDIKMEFGYLTPQQSLKLFKSECKTLKVGSEVSMELKTKIASLSHLAPGDFAAVRRQNRFRPIQSAEEFLERLAEEVSVKKESQEGTKMGFLQ